MRKLNALEIRALYGVSADQYEKIREDIARDAQAAEEEESQKAAPAQDETPSIADLARESRIIK